MNPWIVDFVPKNWTQTWYIPPRTNIRYESLDRLWRMAPYWLMFSCKSQVSRSSSFKIEPPLISHQLLYINIWTWQFYFSIAALRSAMSSFVCRTDLAREFLAGPSFWDTTCHIMSLIFGSHGHGLGILLRDSQVLSILVEITLPMT